MLLWQMILRDADTLLASPDAAWGWFEQHTPGMWFKGDEGKGMAPPDRIWTTDAWEECCGCVQKLKLLVRVKDDPDCGEAPLNLFIFHAVNRHLSRHTRTEIRETAHGLERVTLFVHWPSGERARFRSGSTPDDCPGAFWAYVYLSVVDQQVIPLRGGGHCEDCGKLLGMTPRGKPRTGLCAACRQRLHRTQNPEGARKANRIHNEDYRGRQAEKKRKRAKLTPPTKPSGGK